ncbi:MAG TPA: hypothetical protein VEL51_01180 [Vicinamibacterales bacterium]|nr:hypothetical protein [Vicinamibacterales bacterium]
MRWITCEHVGVDGVAALFIGGTLKIAYDVLPYASFRQVKPPEEAAHGEGIA